MPVLLPPLLHIAYSLLQQRLVVIGTVIRQDIELSYLLTALVCVLSTGIKPSIHHQKVLPIIQYHCAEYSLFLHLKELYIPL